MSVPKSTEAWNEVAIARTAISYSGTLRHRFSERWSPLPPREIGWRLFILGSHYFSDNRTS